MDQVKMGSKTLLDFFQASLAKKCKSNNALDSPTPRLSTNNPSYATLSSEIGEMHYDYFCSDEKSSDNCHQNEPSDQKLKRKLHLILSC